MFRECLMLEKNNHYINNKNNNIYNDNNININKLHQ
jgi:hypothetical protein